MLAIVFGGGNALGAYCAGAADTLAAEAVEPGWVAGSSIGAITAALWAGNPPEKRMPAMREFWRRAAQQEFVPSWLPDALRRPLHFTAALQARIAGRPHLFHLRLAELLAGSGSPGLYERAPMRRTLDELIDFDLLNRGTPRLSLMTVDVATGEEVPFDTARDRIGIDHLMASSAFIPDFPAVEVDGRLLADGGLAANVPADLVLSEPPAEPLACITVDLFPLVAPRPRRLADALERQTDLSFACQTVRTLASMRRLWEARGPGPGGSVYRINYRHREAEVAAKSYDFAQSSLDTRWAEGQRDMQAALRLWRESPPSGPGLQLHAAGEAT